MLDSQIKQNLLDLQKGNTKQYKPETDTRQGTEKKQDNESG